MSGSSGARSTVRLLARLLGAGWHVALSIAFGAGIGHWLDRRFETRPALTLAGLGLGLVVAFAGMIRILGTMWDGDSKDAGGPAPPGDERRGRGSSGE